MKFCCFSSLSSTLLVCIQIFLQFNNAANDFKLRTTTASRNRSSIAKSNPKARISNNAIRTRIGTSSPQEQACQCVLFYLCDKDDVFESPTPSASTIQCEDLQVCCRVPYNVNDSLPSEPETSLGNNLTTSTSAPPCVCVQASRCSNIPDPAVSGAGNIDIRQPACNAQEVCCPTTDIRMPSEVTPPVIPPGGDSTTRNIECGRRTENIANRIVSPENLKLTSFGEFPWMALVLTSDMADGELRENVFVCGASLLSATVLLTAAHCIYDKNVTALKVRVGEYDTHLGAMNEPLPHQDRMVSQIRIHPNFNSKVLFNDMALLVVDQPFNFALNVAPICFPILNSMFESQDVYDGSRCVATGWGKDAFGVNALYQTVLKKVDLALVDAGNCQQRLRRTRLGQYFILDKSFICAGGQAGADTCEGDGGGPLICALRTDPSRYMQVGIVSWGIGCGEQIPAVYASLLSNIEWLTTEFTRI